MPPESWPESPEDRRRVRQAIKETGWASALVVRGQPWDIIDVQNIGYRNREALLYVRRIE